MTDLTRQAAANHVLNVAMGEGHPPGDFFQKIIEAGFKADPSNRAAIRRAWPNLGRALDLYKDDDNGYIILRKERDEPDGDTRQ